MRYYHVYRALLPFVGAKRAGTDPISRILYRHRARSFALCCFDGEKLCDVQTGGMANARTPVEKDAFFRTASVAKMVSAMMACHLVREGKLALGRDAGEYLGTPLRNPRYPDVPVTVRMLLCHTSSLMDAPAFWQGAKAGALLPHVLSQDVFSHNRPGETFQYSNFGAGVLGAVLEGASGMCLDDLLTHVFPGVRATFYPQHLPPNAVLADCFDVLPKRRQYDALALRKRPCQDKKADPLRHYALAHGNLCITCRDLALIGQKAMVDYEELRIPQVSFGARDPHITEGLGMFIIRDEELCDHVVYGHQGLAYGAVNGLFFDPAAGKGFVLLTGGVSVARKFVLADVNRALIQRLLGGKNHDR